MVHNIEVKGGNSMGGNSMLKSKGQVAAVLPLLLVLLVLVGVVILILTQIKRPGEPSTTNPALVYVGASPAAYVADTQSVTPAPTAEEVLERILANAGIPRDGAGVVTSTSNFQIEWLGGGATGPNGFLIEIRSTDLAGAKAEAEQWLINEGFEPEDLCQGITVSFYVSSSVRTSLPAGTSFNPNPSCY